MLVIVSEDAFEDQWEMNNPDREIIDLTAHWGKVMLDHCCKWQRDFNGYSDDADHISSIWIKELVMNSLDPELKCKCTMPACSGGGNARSIISNDKIR